MKTFPTLVAGALAALALSPLNAQAQRGGDDEPRSFEVTITNLSATTFTPLLVVAHKDTVSLFEAGSEASDELALLAEGGATGPFEQLLSTLPDVIGDVETTGGLLGPGQTVVVRLDTTRPFGHVSVLSMLLPTNDSFVGLNTERLPRFNTQKFEYTAIGYDAGSEPNDELCANIPGPQCGGAGPSPDAGGEGYIRVSPGIHGEGDLAASDYDWRNPVARVSVERIN